MLGVNAGLKSFRINKTLKLTQIYTSVSHRLKSFRINKTLKRELLASV